TRTATRPAWARVVSARFDARFVMCALLGQRIVGRTSGADLHSPVGEPGGRRSRVSSQSPAVGTAAQPAARGWSSCRCAGEPGQGGPYLADGRTTRGTRERLTGGTARQSVREYEGRNYPERTGLPRTRPARSKPGWVHS